MKKKSITDNTAKSEKSISPYSIAISASQILLSDLSIKILFYQEKISEKTEPEALHDYRIAIRRVRSLLSHLDEVFPEPGLSQYRVDFAELTSKTNMLRDLEVCIDMLLTIESVYPSVQTEQIQSLVDFMCNKEKKERDYLIRYLNSSENLNFMDGWSKYLDQTKHLEIKMERSDSPIRLVAAEAICYRYLKLVKLARKTASRTSIEKIHIIRKYGKKLRYRIDAFSILYSHKVVKKNLGELKKFQEKLGKMQDIEVQTRLIADIIEEMGNINHDKNNSAIERILSKKSKQKEKMQKKVLKLIKKYPNNSRKKIEDLITI